MDQFEIKMKYPLTAPDGKPLKTLSMRRPTVKDLKLAGRGNQDEESREIALLAILTGLVPEDFDQMDLADYKVLQGQLREMINA